MKFFGPPRPERVLLRRSSCRVELHSPREESFPIPLSHMDVSRTTKTNLDVRQERRIDDYWNIDGSRDLHEAGTKGAKVHFVSLMDICHLKNAELEAKAPKVQKSSCTPRRFWER